MPCTTNRILTIVAKIMIYYQFLTVNKLFFCRIPRSVQFSRLLEKDQEKHIREIKKYSSKPNKKYITSNYNNTVATLCILLLSTLLPLIAESSFNTGSAHSYDVFLGGSCNPTTWRKDLAIPYLQDAGVSFYNPVSILYPHITLLVL